MNAKRISIGLASGLRLSALEAGSGRPLLMIPGWSQPAAAFGRNIDALATGRRVIALDMRGHGESDRPAGGYRIQRFAMDLAEVLDALDLAGVDLLGHSMGASIIWSYLDLFGPRRLNRLVLVDQAPMVTALPGWGEDERADFGCLLPDLASAGGFCDMIRATGDIDGTMGVLRGMFTPALPEADLRWIATENLKLPRGAAADLLFDHILADWRDVIAGIRLPSLVIGGESSIFSARSQRWIAGRNPHGQVSIFPTSEGGAHFMFYENPTRFNAEVAAFLDG